MRDNSTSIVVIIYMSIFLFYCLIPILELIDFESLDLPWDYARITDVDYTVKVLDEPGKRR